MQTFLRLLHPPWILAGLPRIMTVTCDFIQYRQASTNTIFNRSRPQLLRPNLLRVSADLTVPFAVADETVPSKYKATQCDYQQNVFIYIKNQRDATWQYVY